jgi:DNA-binding beta-propeller fold protein YncE
MSEPRGPVGRWVGVLALLPVLAAAGPAAAAEPTLELVQTIVLKGKAGGLDHLMLDAKRERVFLANKVNNTLDIADLKEGKLLKQLPNQQGVQGLAYAPDLDRLFAALGTGGFCNVFDGDGYKLLKTHNFKDDADNVRYHAPTHLVYVAHAEASIGVIDAKSLEVKADIKLPGAAEGFERENGRPRLYVCIPSPSQVAVIDTEKNEVVTGYPVKMTSNPYALAIDEANRRIYVGGRKAPVVVVLDSETGKELSNVAIPEGIDDLSLDAKRKRLYASCGEGFVAVLKQTDADHCEVIDKVPTAKGAKTSYFDPATGRLFVGVPRQEGKEGPEIRVYQAKP